MNLTTKEICAATTLNRISTAHFPDSVLREVMKLDKNHDGFLDAAEISTALTLLSKYSRFSGFGGIVPIVCGKSPKAQKLRRDIGSAGLDPQRRPVVVSGEAGLEKETIATLIHQSQGGSGCNLVYRVHCDTCSMSEIFGTEEKPGLLDQLSDRVDSVLFSNLETLARKSEADELCRLFQRRTYYSGFHHEERPCTARLLAVCKSIPDELRSSPGVINIAVAPLKLRASDLPMIANAVLRSIARRRGLPDITLSPDAVHRIKAYGWPDNLREVDSYIHDSRKRSLHQSRPKT
jgi:two-component system response regulator PilR (NtrC family)